MVFVTPGIGLLFWMLLSFSFVLIILRKFAWKPILQALKDRENTIDKSLKTAEKARKEMAKLKADNEKIIAQAKEERDNLIREAKEIRDKIIGEAKTQASEEANKIIQIAQATIESEKAAAINEIKKEIATLSVDIAEKVLTKELEAENKQEKYIAGLIDEVNLN